MFETELTYHQHHEDSNFGILHTFDDYSVIDRQKFDGEKSQYYNYIPHGMLSEEQLRDYVNQRLHNVSPTDASDIARMAQWLGIAMKSGILSLSLRIAFDFPFGHRPMVQAKANTIFFYIEPSRILTTKHLLLFISTYTCLVFLSRF